MSNEQEQTEGSSHPTHKPQPVDEVETRQLLTRFFSMFKDDLEKKLEDKGKQIEQKSKIDKEVVQLKIQSQPEAVRAKCRIRYHHRKHRNRI